MFKITSFDEDFTASGGLLHFSEPSFINQILIKNKFVSVFVFHNTFNDIRVPGAQRLWLSGLTQPLGASLRLALL